MNNYSTRKGRKSLILFVFFLLITIILLVLRVTVFGDTGQKVISLSNQLVIVKQPEIDSVVYVGSKFELNVVVEGTGKINYTWLGTDVGLDKPMEPVFTNNKMIVPTNLQSEVNSKRYKFWVIITNGESTIESEKCTVLVTRTKVVDKPTITKDLPKYQEVKKGDEISLSIEATGQNLSYSWYYLDFKDNKILIDKEIESSLVVPKKDSDTVGDYRYIALVRNVDEEATASTWSSIAMVRVRPTDYDFDGVVEIKHKTPSRVVASRGQEVEMSVDVQGDSIIKIEWFESIINYSQQFYTLDKYGENNSVEKKDLGTYYYIARAEFMYEGQRKIVDSQPFEVQIVSKVLDDATINTQPEKDSKVEVCGELVLSVSASNDSHDVIEIGYQWYSSTQQDFVVSDENKIDGATSPTHKVDTATIGINYYCVKVISIYSTILSTSVVSDLAKVSVVTLSEKPKLVSQLGSREIYIDEEVVFRVEATVNEGNLIYEWYKNDENKNSGGTKIDGETKETLSQNFAKKGIYYFYVKVYNDDGVNAISSVVSNVSLIVVRQSGASYDTNWGFVGGNTTQWIAIGGLSFVVIIVAIYLLKSKKNVVSSNAIGRTNRPNSSTLVNRNISRISNRSVGSRGISPYNNRKR
ncbi:MAG: hypothetical protein FWF56_02350 [Firmicutes bacterium]|nr:hypothetical protein [Bacillota bacterium]MCL1953838.1 hypothetical protein [Bacillota bacterium]